MSSKYSIGIDYGTESARAVLVDVYSGNEIASSVFKYPDGVIDEYLPGTNIKLPPDFALQNPADYVTAAEETIRSVIKESGINPIDIIGLGTDFTACTMMPMDGEGTPLCLKPEFKDNPHAWVKLWKHHAAQPEADRLNEIARKRGEKFLQRYGGKISSEWLIPKIMQILDEAPEIYDAADKFIEAADWIVFRMTGCLSRNSCTAGYKAIWDKDEGYPSRDFFKALDPKLEDVVQKKLSLDIVPLGNRAGNLTKEFADMTGLTINTAVSIGNVDAHVSVPATTVTEEGKMVMIMGTSICHMILGREKMMVEGMCGVVGDGILSDYFGFEAGQSGVGDIFAWFVENAVPEEYQIKARQEKIDIHTMLEREAAKLEPGESGLLALDWLNGNRSILVDVDLTGLIVGLTLNSKPHEIYRALIEATAFGTNMIIGSFEEKGVQVKELYACGGLPEKNTLLMQIYSDVTGREIKLAASPQAPALGSAMFGAVAAGKANGGYDSIVDAAKAMAKIKEKVYKPDMEANAVYRKLFELYKILHDYFGRDPDSVMKQLKRIKLEMIK
ncbi:MAG: ribulokinase [Actinobacteria bacterium]|nr:ribulokinase [Actinomycetota bacterium]